jgi:hypothetical protein
VDAHGVRDVWASCGDGSVVHWHGAAWSTMQTALQEPLTSIRMVSPTVGWAVGLPNHVVRWDGTSWSPDQGPDDAGKLVTWGGVWSASADEVWVVWDDVWHRTRGGSWQKQEAPYFPVWGIAAADAWGFDVRPNYANDSGTTALAHWDGVRWTEVASGTNATLNGIWGRSSADVYAVGSQQTLVHWDGSRWLEVTTNATCTSTLDCATFLGVWARSASDVWAVGKKGHGWGAPGAIQHWDGAAWTPILDQDINGDHGVPWQIVGDDTSDALLAIGDTLMLRP